MITYIVIAVVALIVVLLLIAASRPSNFRVERSASIPVPAPIVFAQVNDLRKWEAWSPWAKLDPNATQTYSGPRAGTGASFAWVGNNKIGEGRMTVVDSRAPEFVRFRLEFLKPFKATNTAEFTFASKGDSTIVTWAMSGKYNLMFKVVGLFMNCDDMCGKQFEQGLANLKAVSSEHAKAFV